MLILSKKNTISIVCALIVQCNPQGTNILTFSLYWGVGSLYIIMDLTKRPSWLRKYKGIQIKINRTTEHSNLLIRKIIFIKVQPGQNEPVDSQRLASVISTLN